MGTITIHETVDAPAETVFDYIDDYRNTTKYMQGLTKWSPTTDVTHGRGSKFAVAMKAGPTTLDSVVEITTWTANKVIGWKSIEGFKQKGQWALKPKGEQTDVTFTMEYELPGGFAGRMLSRAAEPVVRSNLQRSAATLRQHAERHTPKKPGATSGAKASPAKSTAKSSSGAKSTSKKSSARKSSAKASSGSSTTKGTRAKR